VRLRDNQMNKVLKGRSRSQRRKRTRRRKIKE
jgi:hypothetical protein